MTGAELGLLLCVIVVISTIKMSLLDIVSTKKSRKASVGLKVAK